MKRNIGITVSAMLLAAQLGSPLAAQEPSIDKLAAIAAYLENNQIEELRAFVQANPELLVGESAMAVLLRQFMSESGNLTEYLAIEPQLLEEARRSQGGSDGPTGGPFGQGRGTSSDDGFEPAAGIY